MAQARRFRRAAWVALVVGIVLATLAAATGPHWWIRVWSAGLMYNGVTSGRFTLYRSWSGNLLLHLHEPGGGLARTYYTAEPRTRSVFAPNGGNYVATAWFAFEIHTDQGGVDLAYEAKSGTDPRVVCGPTFLEFSPRRGDRIRVSW